jgi:hypothetical protein
MSTVNGRPFDDLSKLRSCLERPRSAFPTLPHASQNGCTRARLAPRLFVSDDNYP